MDKLGELNPIIHTHAQRFSLPPELVTNVVRVESGGDVFAWRAEPNYRYVWNVAENRPFPTSEYSTKHAPVNFPRATFSSADTEWWGQQSSWGPMQVMGAVARELGYTGPFPALCSANLGIMYGCHLLATLRDRFKKVHGWEGVVAAYNAGSPQFDANGFYRNQEYVNRIESTGLDLSAL